MTSTGMIPAMEAASEEPLNETHPHVEVSPNRRLGFGGWFAVVWLSLIVFGAVFATFIPGIHGYDTTFLDQTSTKPLTNGHLLGVDDNGHDELSNVVIGARTSLEIAIGAVGAGILLGTLGLLAGYHRGTIDLLISTVFDVLLAVPALILALALASFLRGDPSKSSIPAELVLIIALGTVSTPVLGRITRASALTWSQREFVMAARAQGAKSARIMVREVLPNVLPAMFSIALLAVGVVIVAEGGLSFLGVGIDPTVKPSWGNLIASSASVLNTEPWLVFGPIVCLFFTVLSLNFLGDIVRARFDVREVDGMSPRRKGDERFSDAPLDGPLLEVKDVITHFKTGRGVVRAVDGVSFSLERGKTLGIVGESGSGKSVLSKSVMGLLPKRNVVRGGSIKFEGREIGSATAKEMQHYWGTEMSMVFQDPMTALNPVMRVGKQITESLRYHLDVSRDYAQETALALLESVGIPEPQRRLREYSFQLSGGMRQRVMLAIALACGPKMLFADEPTTALDVTVQAQILDLLQTQQRERFMAMILVTHDLGVVAGRADDIAVMYAGKIVEKAPARTLFSQMRHPYTEALMKSIPKLALPSHTRLESIAGRPPDLTKPPKGCNFAPRCPYAQSRCHEEEPALEPHGTTGHEFACFYPVGTPEGADALAHNAAASGPAPAPDAGTTAASPASGNA